MPVSKALLGENVPSELLELNVAPGNNPTKWRLAKDWFSVWKKAKNLELFKSTDSNECSPLSTHTFTDQKPPKKLR